MTARTLVIQPDGTHEYRDVPTMYPAFNQAVLDGGFMECVYGVWDDEQVVFTFDEEGGPYIKNLPRNAKAEELLERIFGQPGMLCGPVAVNGYQADAMTDVPKGVESLFKEL